MITIDDYFWNSNVNFKKYHIHLIHNDYVFAKNDKFIDYINLIKINSIIIC